jgi:hypothetical protein
LHKQTSSRERETKTSLCAYMRTSPPERQKS